jgi:hypothetical protein
MAAPDPQVAPTAAALQDRGRAPSRVRTLGMLVIIAGVILIVSGIVTWFLVRSELSDEQITVSDDASFLAGSHVDDPLSAYFEAHAIKAQALAATEGTTFAELPQDDPARQTVVIASFLRATLFTSVVAFGVSALSVGLGIVLILIGFSLRMIVRD